MRRRRRQQAAFRFQPYSQKQLQLLTWWMDESPYRDYDMLIADGSIRAGKTIAMIDGFVTWSMAVFGGMGVDFIIAGRTMGALKRNVIAPMLQILNAKGIPFYYHRSENWIEIAGNTYYLFGANNERAQDVLQGLTAAGALADEVALFPQNFVEQMIGRCSVEGSRLWFNANPQGPFHHLKRDYIDKAEEKRIVRLQFTLDDNLTLSDAVKERYRRMFSGLFYQRNILGLWVAAEGVIFDMWDNNLHVVDKLPKMRRYWTAADYGTANPTVFLLIGEGVDNRLYVCDEWRWDSKAKGRRLTDAQISAEYRKWIAGLDIVPLRVFIDPSAASLIEQMWADGVRGIQHADNAVVDGIQDVSTLLGADLLRVHKRAEGLIEEMGSYVWDAEAQKRGEDKPLQQNDHGPDGLRYGVRGLRRIWRPWVTNTKGVAA